MRRLPLACSLLAALSFAAAPVGAQTHVTVTGTITDAVSGAPVVGASVMFGRSRQTVWSDDHGRFVARVDPGAEWLTIQQLGYQKGGLAVAVASGMQPLSVTLDPDPVMLERLEVIGQRLSARTEAALMGGLHAFDTRDLGFATSWSVMHFLRTRGAVDLVPCQRPHMRFCVWSRGLGVPAQVYLDGMRLYGGMDELEFVPVADLYRIEVFRRGIYIQVLTKWWAARAATHKGWESELPLFIPEPTLGTFW